MKSNHRNTFALIIVTFVVSVFFLKYTVQPSLHHHLQQTAWLSGHIFLAGFLKYAGGPGEYIALFISQFFGSDTLSAIIIALFAALVVFLLFKTFQLIQKRFHSIYYVLPVMQIIIAALFCNYLFPFSGLLNLTVVILFLYCTVLIGKRLKMKIWYPVLIFSPVLYYVSGGMYFLIFMLSSLLMSVNKSVKFTLINTILILAEVVFIPWLAFKYVFDSSIFASYFKSTPDVAVMLRYSKPVLFYIGLGLIPGIILLFTITELISGRNKQDESQHVAIKARWYNKEIFKLALSYLIIIGVAVFAVYQSYKPQEKLKAEIDYYAYHEGWRKVLELSEKIEGYDRMVNFQFNRAISHQRVMLDKLFNYEQLLGSQGLFLDRPFAGEITLPNSDLYFDLGNIDESLRLAFESQTLMPESPRVLKRLVKDCIVQQKKIAANTYLNVLAANPVEKDWAEKYRKLNGETGPSSDSEIELKRKEMVKAEGIRVIPRKKVLSLLEHNPQNRTAFEYVVAFDLMEHDLNAFLEDMEYFPAFRYPQIPTVLEEAIVLFRSQRPNVTELLQYRISPETIKRFKEFASLTSANRGNREKARQATVAYKNTYWYYVLFLSPLVTNVKLETQAVDANY